MLNSELPLIVILQSLVSLFACTNLDYVFNVVYENLTVAYLTGIECVLGNLYDLFNRNLANYDLDLHLRKKSCVYGNATIELS